MRNWIPDPPDLGPFSFRGDATLMRPLSLRSGPDGILRDADGRSFCAAGELDAAGALDWRGLSPIIVREHGGPGAHAIWLDGRGIDTPSTFRRFLGPSWA